MLEREVEDLKAEITHKREIYDKKVESLEEEIKLYVAEIIEAKLKAANA
jgi:hypothetical protein